MDIFRSFGGTVRLEYTSADISAGLRAINAAGIQVSHVEHINDLTLRFTVSRADAKQLRRITDRRGETLRIFRGAGIYWFFKRLIRRPVLVAGLLLILLLTLYLPSRILFVEVQGNLAVPTRQIIAQAAQCGIGFGVSRREVRSERMKNALLESIPELQWAGINTYGCRAVISVRERTEPERQEQDTGVSSIVAARDGVIRELTVVSGSPVCKVGQSVKEGQVLVSGYSDLGICIRAEHAEGEIFAETSRTYSAAIPSQWLQRGQQGSSSKKYSLIIGKKRINFTKGSGISPTSCGKMYAEYYLTLPGGFQLPVALAVEEWSDRETDAYTIDEAQAQSQLSRYAQADLTAQMVAGSIEAKYEAFSSPQGLYCLTGRYACYEMIGKSRPEEILENYEANRTNG